jgi:3-oxoacyl-[acyl-carrier protein] reductase
MTQVTDRATTGRRPGPLAGQVGVVSGASGGIGRAIAAGLAEAGMAVAMLGRDAERLAEAVAEAAVGGGTALAVPVELTRPDDVVNAVSRIDAALGPVDLLVNGAGRIETTEVPVWQSDPDDWWATVEVDLRGPYLLARSLLPGMVARRRGRVVDLNSGFGTRDGDIYSAYAVSKTGLFRLGGAIASAGAAHGICAFQVAPGVVRTAMTAGMPMWHNPPEQGWTPVDRVVSLVRAIAEGRLDALSGRYLRADVDDVETLLQRSQQIIDTDARTLRIRSWGADDPV